MSRVYCFLRVHLLFLRAHFLFLRVHSPLCAYSDFDPNTIYFPSRPTVDARAALYTTAHRQAEDTRIQIRKQHAVSVKRGKWEKRSIELEEVGFFFFFVFRFVSVSYLRLTRRFHSFCVVCILHPLFLRFHSIRSKCRLNRSFLSFVSFDAFPSVILLLLHF